MSALAAPAAPRASPPPQVPPRPALDEPVPPRGRGAAHQLPRVRRARSARICRAHPRERSCLQRPRRRPAVHLALARGAAPAARVAGRLARLGAIWRSEQRGCRREAASRSRNVLVVLILCTTTLFSPRRRAQTVPRALPRVAWPHARRAWTVERTSPFQRIHRIHPGLSSNAHSRISSLARGATQRLSPAHISCGAA